MKILDFTGLGVSETKKTVKELQQLLADLHVFYMNTRGCHWHIEGGEFFILHEKFEELYESIGEQIDEVAERILMLDARPENRFSEFLKVSNVKEIGGVSGTNETVQATIDSFKVVLKQMRKIEAVANESGDGVTVDLMNSFLGEHEKRVWMFVAFIR